MSVGIRQTETNLFLAELLHQTLNLDVSDKQDIYKNKRDFRLVIKTLTYRRDLAIYGIKYV